MKRDVINQCRTPREKKKRKRKTERKKRTRQEGKWVAVEGAGSDGNQPFVCGALRKFVFSPICLFVHKGNFHPKGFYINQSLCAVVSSQWPRHDFEAAEQWWRRRRAAPPAAPPMHFVPSVSSVICFGVLISAKSIIFFVV